MASLVRCTTSNVKINKTKEKTAEHKKSEKTVHSLPNRCNKNKNKENINNKKPLDSYRQMKTTGLR